MAAFARLSSRPSVRSRLEKWASTSLKRYGGSPPIGNTCILFAAAFNDRPSANGMAAALAAYERTFSTGTSRFDRYIANNRAVTLTRMELDGYSIFQTTAGCSNCHQLQPTANRGTSALSLFTDFRFHNLGIGYAAGRFADPGRYRVTGVETDYRSVSHAFASQCGSHAALYA